MAHEVQERAQRWGRQLRTLFAWWLVIEFGLTGLVLGGVVAVWPSTPEFLAAAAGSWLLLLAGCRVFSALAHRAGWTQRAALAEAALCAGTGMVVLHAEWPARASANATALTFAAAVVAVCALLDGVLARFGPRDRAQPIMVRAVGWLAGALALMALMNVSEATALTCAAGLVGLAEIMHSVLLLSPAARLEFKPSGRPEAWTRPSTRLENTDAGLSLLR